MDSEGQTGDIQTHAQTARLLTGLSGFQAQWAQHWKADQEDHVPLEKATGVSGVSQEAGGFMLQVGSGSYEFGYEYANGPS